MDSLIHNPKPIRRRKVCLLGATVTILTGQDAGRSGVVESGSCGYWIVKVGQQPVRKRRQELQVNHTSQSGDTTDDDESIEDDARRNRQRLDGAGNYCPSSNSSAGYSEDGDGHLVHTTHSSSRQQSHKIEDAAELFMAIVNPSTETQPLAQSAVVTAVSESTELPQSIAGVLQPQNHHVPSTISPQSSTTHNTAAAAAVHLPPYSPYFAAPYHPHFVSPFSPLFPPFYPPPFGLPHYTYNHPLSHATLPYSPLLDIADKLARARAFTAFANSY